MLLKIYIFLNTTKFSFMPRQPRISPIGIPQHIIVRGNYRGLFKQVLSQKLMDNIRKITNKGMAIGNEIL